MLLLTGKSFPLLACTLQPQKIENGATEGEVLPWQTKT